VVSIGIFYLFSLFFRFSLFFVSFFISFLSLYLDRRNLFGRSFLISFSLKMIKNDFIIMRLRVSINIKLTT